MTTLVRTPSLDHHTLSDAEPAVEWLLEGEPGHDEIIDPSFFDKLRGHRVVEYDMGDWPHLPVRFPMVYTNVSLISATFTIPAAEAAALAPRSRRLKLVRSSPRRTPITFFAFDYGRSGLGRYREMGVALPLVLDGRLTPPMLPALMEAIRPGSHPKLGMYAVELPVDQAQACDGGIKLYGLPKVVGEAEFSLAESSGSASLTCEGRKVAELRVELDGPLGPPKVRPLPITTISLLDGRIIRTAYESIADGHITRRGSAEFVPGEHPRFQKFHGLSLSSKPLELRLIRRLNWIIWGPEDMGPA